MESYRQNSPHQLFLDPVFSVMKSKITGEQLSDRLNQMLQSIVSVTLRISEFQYFRNSKLVQAKGKLVSKVIEDLCANAEFFKDNRLGDAWYQRIEQNNCYFNNQNAEMTSYRYQGQSIQEQYDNQKWIQEFGQQNSIKGLEQLIQDYQNTIEIQRLVASHISQYLEMNNNEVALFHYNVDKELDQLSKKVDSKQFVEEQELEKLKQNLDNAKNLNQQVIDKIREGYENKFQTEITQIEKRTRELEEIRNRLKSQNTIQQVPYQYSILQGLLNPPQQPVQQQRPNTANQQEAGYNQNPLQHLQSSQQRQISTAYGGQHPNLEPFMNGGNPNAYQPNYAANPGLNQQQFITFYPLNQNLNQQLQQNMQQNPPMSNWQALNKRQNENLNTPIKHEHGLRPLGVQANAHNIIQSNVQPSYFDKKRQSREQSQKYRK